MKLGTKIILGFGSLLAIAIALGVIAILMMRGVQEKSDILANEYIPEVEQMLAVTQQTYMMRLQVLGIALNGDEKYYDAAKKVYNDLDKQLKGFDKLVNDSEHLTKGRESSKILSSGVNKYWVVSEDMQDANEKIKADMQAQRPIGRDYAKIASTIVEGERATVLASTPETLAGNLKKYDMAVSLQQMGLKFRLDSAAAWRDRDMARLEEALTKDFPEIENTAEALRKLSPENSANLAKLLDLANSYKGTLTRSLDNWKKLNSTLDNAVSIGGEVINATVETGNAASSGTSAIAKSTNEALTSASLILVIGLVIAAIVGTLLAIFITNGITGPVNRIINNLTESGEQVAAASGQISSASQSLAEGATEQAASLEESSSALEEMASMTRQNADNAGNANQMMVETQKQVSNGAGSVRNMASAMSEINDSSEQISRIIKTIEEIAFQTNLLALNAAVEAARAGDAGKGFAVVADEVRNLAQRSAQAARDTADLIESTVARVKNGTEIVEELQESFGNVEKAANGVAGLINEISAASNEQAQGVDQVNTAVAQMDKVTQTNAANAEESASAAEELNAQAEQLRSLVGDLVKLVRGRDAVIENHGMHSVPKLHATMSHKPLSLPHSSRSGVGSSSGSSAAKKITSSSAKLVKPNEVIPLDDDDDFSDF